MLTLEHNKATYWADYLIYTAVVGVLTVCLGVIAQERDWAVLLALCAGGVFMWSLVEYLIHRFVLHAIEPFKSWHATHHERPTALISAPTALTATLITLLVFLPAWAVSSIRHALSLTLGLTVGYLAYSFCHHATHHWRASGTWLKRRKLWHAIHHGRGQSLCFGVTSTLWDRLFRTGPSPR